MLLFIFCWDKDHRGAPFGRSSSAGAVTVWPSHRHEAVSARSKIINIRWCPDTEGSRLSQRQCCRRYVPRMFLVRLVTLCSAAVLEDEEEVKRWKTVSILPRTLPRSWFDWSCSQDTILGGIKWSDTIERPALVPGLWLTSSNSTSMVATNSHRHRGRRNQLSKYFLPFNRPLSPVFPILDTWLLIVFRSGRAWWYGAPHTICNRFITVFTGFGRENVLFCRNRKSRETFER